jgi:glycosyltransferase involved in cell wall biosynthesis
MAKDRILYVVYWGALEPLGQSLVLPAVKRMAEMGAELTLVTFEKAADLERQDEVDGVRTALHRFGISWVPQRYHKRPKIPATAYDIAHGVASALKTGLRSKFDLIHARTFVGGLIGLALAPLLRAKLVYHNEGFYPDEQVDGGVWRQDSTAHRVAKFLELRLYARAAGIITLSTRAKAVIEDLEVVRSNGTPVVVVRSCVDLDRFQPGQAKVRSKESGLRLVYIGSVGGRYILDKVAEFVKVASREMSGVRLRVLTRAHASVAEEILRDGGLPEGSWSIDGLPYSEIPAELAHHDAGLFFLTQGISEHGCSPTKIGEYWAMGLPVVTTPNVSDTEEIVRRERVGVVVTEHTAQGYRRAFEELRLLLQDDDLAQRCRRAAKTHYALEPACRRQMTLYEEVIRGARDRKGAIVGDLTEPNPNPKRLGVSHGVARTGVDETGTGNRPW